jgi:hypothetical protein
MASPLYSRASYVAHDRLADAGIRFSKGHLRETIAALYGFGSLAAMQADPWLSANAPNRHLMVVVDAPRALARVESLRPDLNASQIVETVCSVLETLSTPTAFVLRYFQSYSHPLSILARKCVLTQPTMAGVVYDVEVRMRELMEPRDMGGEGRNELMATLEAGAEDPVQINHSTMFEHVLGLAHRSTGTFTAADRTEGTMRVELVFARRGGALYEYADSVVTFRPGDIYDDVVEDYISMD